MKKFILTDETIELLGVTLHRIKAVRSFGNVKEGDLGGFVEKEDNISENFYAWVSDDARVSGNAEVCGDARVSGNVEVFGNAKVFGDAEVCGDAVVSGYARVSGNAVVSGDARVSGNAVVSGDAKVSDDARVSGNAEVYGDARVFDDARVYGDARVSGNAKVSGNAEVCGDARVSGKADYIVFKNFWSSSRFFTWTRSNNMWRVGCFYGTAEELIKEAYADSDKSGREYERVVKYVQSILEDEKYE